MEVARAAFGEQPCSARCLWHLAARLPHSQRICLLTVSKGLPMGSSMPRAAADHVDTGKIFVSVLSS